MLMQISHEVAKRIRRTMQEIVYQGPDSSSSMWGVQLFGHRNYKL